MSLLAVHLEQIAISCDGINSLPIFTNALLSNHDITSLIRDTEAHERALFSVPPAARQHHSSAAALDPDNTSSASLASAAAGVAAAAASDGKPRSSRRQTVFNVASGEVTAGPPAARAGAAGRRNTAVAAVLGGDLHERLLLRRAEGGGGGGAGGGGDVDVEVLLRGAEKLCGVYAPPRALDRIVALRNRHATTAGTLAYYEGRVAEQAKRLDMMRARGDPWENRDGGPAGKEEIDEAVVAAEVVITEEDLSRDEEEARALERKKRELQARLRAMERDLGGLQSME